MSRQWMRRNRSDAKWHGCAGATIYATARAFCGISLGMFPRGWVEVVNEKPKDGPLCTRCLAREKDYQ